MMNISIHLMPNADYSVRVVACNKPHSPAWFSVIEGNSKVDITCHGLDALLRVEAAIRVAMMELVALLRDCPQDDGELHHAEACVESKVIGNVSAK